MHSNWWMSLLSGSEMLGLAGVIAAILWKRLAWKWPFLFAAVAVELATDTVLLSLLHSASSHPRSHYRAYFMVYWIMLGVQALLRLGIIADILRSFPGLDFLPWKLYFFVGLLGATMAGASAIYCFHDAGGKLPVEIQDTAVLISRCVNIAWVTFSVAVLGAIKLFSFRWSEQGARIATGVFLRICANMIVAELLTQSKDVRAIANGLDSFCSILVFSLWIYVLATIPPSPELPHVEDSPCNRRELLALLEN